LKPPPGIDDTSTVILYVPSRANWTSITLRTWLGAFKVTLTAVNANRHVPTTELPNFAASCGSDLGTGESAGLALSAPAIDGPGAAGVASSLRLARKSPEPIILLEEIEHGDEGAWHLPNPLRERQPARKFAMGGIWGRGDKWLAFAQLRPGAVQLLKQGGRRLAAPAQEDLTERARACRPRFEHQAVPERLLAPARRRIEGHDVESLGHDRPGCEDEHREQSAQPRRAQAPRGG
jgi:hypothetical protein